MDKGDTCYILLGTTDMDLCPYEAEAARWDYYLDGDEEIKPRWELSRGRR